VGDEELTKITKSLKNIRSSGVGPRTSWEFPSSTVEAIVYSLSSYSLFERQVWLKGWFDSQRFEDLREIIQEICSGLQVLPRVSMYLLMNQITFKAIRNSNFASIVYLPATKPDRLFSQFYTKSMSKYY
jgi:hypothetical protein